MYVYIAKTFEPLKGIYAALALNTVGTTVGTSRTTVITPRGY